MGFVSRYLEPAMVDRLNHLQLSARRAVEGSASGLHKSPFKGASIEFRQHRFYVAGDELRRLDWRVLGRTGRPYIKEYDEETNLRCTILLDRSGSMGYAGPGRASKFDFAARLCSALAYLMLANAEQVGLAYFSDALHRWLPPRTGTAQLSRILEMLEEGATAGSSHPAKAMHTMAEHLHRRSLVIVVSDFLAPLSQIRQGLSHLGHDRHEVMVLRVLDRDEVEFPFASWSQFVGLEGEKSRRCEPALMRKIYLDNFEKHARQLQERCRACKAQFEMFLTDQPLLPSITRFLSSHLPQR